MADIRTRIKVAAPRKDQLQRLLTESEYAVSRLQQQDAHVASLQDQIGQANDRVRSLDNRRNVDAEEHSKGSSGKAGRSMWSGGPRPKGDFSDQIDAEERHYLAILQRQHQEQATLTDLESQLEDSELVLAKLASMVRDRQRQQEELEDIYNYIFAGRTPRAAGQDLGEQQCSKALAALHDAASESEIEREAYEMLVQAVNMMEASNLSMEMSMKDAKGEGGSGSGSGRGNNSDSLSLGYMERQALSSAESLLRGAQMLIREALELSPTLAALPGLSVDDGRTVLYRAMDPWRDDLAYYRRVWTVREQVLRSAVELQEALRQARARVRALESTTRMREIEMEEAKKEMQRAREELFERVIRDEAAES